MSIQLRKLEPNELLQGVFELLALHDQHGNGRPGEGELCTVIIKGVLNRLNDPKNAAKNDNWLDSGLFALSYEAHGETIEWLNEVQTHIVNNTNTNELQLETEDVLTTMGMFLQKLMSMRH